MRPFRYEEVATAAEATRVVAHQPNSMFLYRNGTAFVRSAATDLGTGTYTVMTLLASEVLGIESDSVMFGLGDTDMPNSMQEGGSGLAASLGNAVHVACSNLVKAFVDLVKDDEQSPLRGCTFESVTARDGGLQITGDAARFETYRGILARHNLDELTTEGTNTPAEATKTMAPSGAYAAHFVEVRVDSDLGLIRVARVVSVVDAGRVLNEKTARSQIIGGIVGGIGMALLEENVSDQTGRIVNASFGDYLIAVNADVPDVNVVFVGGPDPLTPKGNEGHRRTRDHGHRRGDRQRRLSRHGPSSSIPANLIGRCVVES